MIEPCWLNIQDVCTIHCEIIAESGGESGVLNQGALESTLNKPLNLFHYNSDATLYELAASYGYGLIKNHCFIDGNKRIALIAVYTFLLVNGIELMAAEADAVSFCLELAASLEPQAKSMEKLVRWLQDNSESIDSEI
jgi:death on curing protein